MAKIVNVTAGEDHTLVIELDSLNTISYDMKPRLTAIRFCELADIERFKAVRVENRNTLAWGSLCQITIDEIMSCIER